MDIKQITYMLLKKIKFIIIIPIIVAIITYFVSIEILKPVYQSYTTLYVINKPDGGKPINYNDLLTNQQLVKDYRELIESKTVTRSVLNELGIKNVSPDDLASKISVNLKPDTRVLQIIVNDKNPYRARDLANKTSEKFIEKSMELMSVANINIVDRAELPLKPAKPKPVVNFILALMISFVLTTGLIYLIEYFSDTIKSKEDIEEYLSLSILSTIPLVKNK
ncbi:YveK family protein [Pseudobacteroides cellulosolvens]|uniref:Lipopolysaccharide biosynthesis protein n=1 Tax=Pseudobacteroides cellulosolvens ATCC 35603 = DSM 2933 TaxID=398512 RepID=A0A0L6JIN4_9FIRM|nr:Wzz/FepE/Etk N-terminal domain-containing protein [Pseudobacteroides cellulosolvens]KNY25563.1 lipopolysaccharide biosynthesis protein [Pseudobacteroides cellulosolvens ATCC 35603 = DSM 2933]